MKKLLKKIKASIKKKIRQIIKYVNFKIVVPIAYRFYSGKPKNDKLVLFADLRPRPLHENFEGLYKMCEENGFECVALDGRGFGEDVPKGRRRKARLKFQFDFLRYYAQCKALFLVEYFPLADAVKPRKGTKVVQLWHGCGAMKTMGYAGSSKGWGVSDKTKKTYPMHQYYDMVTVSSEDVIGCYAEAFRVDPKIIKPYGMPRTDIYFDQEYISQAKAKLLEKFPEIGDRKVILFAPTFRGKSIKKSFYNVDFDFRQFKRELGDKYVFVTKFHPLMAKGGLLDSMKVKGHGFVFDGTYDLTPEEALCAADVLISDYSSISFEYLLLDRPVVSYIPDLDEYLAGRGMFFPYEKTMPGPYCFDPEELLETLKTIEETFDPACIKPYRKKFMSGCDGHCTERIFKAVLGE